MSDLQEPTEEQLVEAERDLPVRKFFSYAHLPPHLASGSRPFCELAYHVIATIKRTAERTIALRRILDAKDQAVRCLLLAVVALVFVACRNDAITYAHGVAPEAECQAIETYSVSHGADTAVCRFDRAVWMCIAGSAPTCNKVREIPTEAK